MLRLGRAAAFQDVQEADDVGVHIGRGTFQAVANARLRRQVDDSRGRDVAEQGRHAVAVRQVELGVTVIGTGLQQRQARRLQLGIVVGVQRVEPDNVFAARQQSTGKVEADEARGAGDQDRHALWLAQVGPVTAVISGAAGESALGKHLVEADEARFCASFLPTVEPACGNLGAQYAGA